MFKLAAFVALCTLLLCSSILISVAAAAVAANNGLGKLLVDPDSCLPDKTQGCLNGHNYSWATEEPCGNEIMVAKTSGCCGYGIVFDPSQVFCCMGTIWSYQSGKQCVLSSSAKTRHHTLMSAKTAPTANTATGHAAPAAPATPAAAAAAATTTTTTTRNTTTTKLLLDACTGITPDGLGCVNGITYNMTTEAPCGNWILNLTAGEKCCPNGIKWNQHNESCCFEPSHPGSTYVVVPHPNACSAQ